MKYLVTGAAGFIGMHSCASLLASGHTVIGIDSLNEYYDKNLKLARLGNLGEYNSFHFHEVNLIDRGALENIFKAESIDIVLHLAAQAGVRYSISDPHAYSEANLTGFLNILELCRNHCISHLVYASSSSVYGLNSSLPFREHDNASHPISLYAATKRANELMAHSYSHLYGLPTTGLRFFTVYGPWGRPDMALFLFIDAIIKGKPINIFNNGKMVRDFTYISDAVTAVMRVLGKPATGDLSFDSRNPDPACSSAPYKIFNVGNRRPTSLMDYISALEASLGMVANKNFLPMQAGDVPETCADISLLSDWIDYKPEFSVQRGVDHFVKWYRNFYNV